MTPLALCWLTVPTATPLQLLEAAASGGFSSVGMRVLEAGQPDIGFVGGTGESAAVIRHAAADHGVSILRTAGFRLDGRYSAERFLPYIEASADLGAEYISVIATDSDEQRRTANFADLCERAAQFQLRATVEFVPFSTVKTIQDGYNLLLNAGRADATLLLDALHLYRSGGKADDIRSIPAERFSVAQLCDAPLVSPEPAQLYYEARNDRMDVGNGELPLHQFMRALPAGIPLEVETPCLAECDLPPAERARNALRITREFLATL